MWKLGYHSTRIGHACEIRPLRGVSTPIIAVRSQSILRVSVIVESRPAASKV